MFGEPGSGKSTLCGEFMIQMGQVKKSDINKVSETRHLVDVLEAERKQGHSIETAKVTISEEDTVYNILDTPGMHLNEFLEFAPLAEIAILVVSAKDKSFDTEKLKIAKGLGIRQLIVVVNKMDTVKWAKSNFLEIKASLEPIIKESGFLIADTQFVPISANEGFNLLRNHGWYHGRTLLQALNHQFVLNEDLVLNTQTDESLLLEIYDK